MVEGGLRVGSELKIAWTEGTNVLYDCEIGIIVICIGGTLPAFVSVHQLRREAIRGIDWIFAEKLNHPRLPAIKRL